MLWISCWASMMINWNLLKQIFAFGCVGVTATAVHYGVALFFVDLVNISVFIANILGYCSAVLISLFGHSIFTYKKKVNNHIARRFVIVSLSTLAVSEGILLILEFQLKLSHEVALAIVVLSIPIVTFFLNKFWVYTESHS